LIILPHKTGFMTSSILTISITGLLAGFICSMPIAGPISILITTNAFKGRMRYCIQVNLGASLATFAYVFFAVFGLSKLYSLYQPIIPFLFGLGSVFLLFIGFRIFRTKFDFEQLEDKNPVKEKLKKKEIGGFYTGSMINFFNPTLFIGWLTSTFLILSFVTSLGFDTGGLNKFVKQNVNEIESIDSSSIENNKVLTMSDAADSQEQGEASEGQSSPKNFHLLISVLYALFVSVGSITWFYLLTLAITRFRKFISHKIVSAFIKSLGIVLCLIGLYFAYLAVSRSNF
jgi:threonine/homoserine/homoserine lactone efflux protein